MKNDSNLIWIDLEMTGLDPAVNRIIEIATIVTDSALNILAEGPSLAIYQDEPTLAIMDSWNTKQHNGSGLVARVQNSIETEATAEAKTLQFLQQYVNKGKSPMCGNSICLDRRFLSRYMPTLVNYFHYRHLDVSTLKELTARWRPDLYAKLKKNSSHLALDDIRESIAELLFYKETFLRWDVNE
jgi:oligoribonuclease